jgi:hypothetical protein
MPRDAVATVGLTNALEQRERQYRSEAAEALVYGSRIVRAA